MLKSQATRSHNPLSRTALEHDCPASGRTPQQQSLAPRCTFSVESHVRSCRRSPWKPGLLLSTWPRLLVPLGLQLLSPLGNCCQPSAFCIHACSKAPGGACSGARRLRVGRYVGVRGRTDPTPSSCRRAATNLPFGSVRAPTHSAEFALRCGAGAL